MTQAVATTKGFDVLLVAHATLAIAALVALAVLRAAARSASRDEPGEAARRSFSGRPELAGRLVHLVPLSGLALVALSRGAYALTTPFVLVGLAAWALAAAALEGVGFPAQRAVAAALHDGTDPRAAARRLGQATEVAMLAVVAATVVMVVANAT